MWFNMEKEMATHSCSCLENPRDGEPGGLSSMGLHRIENDWSNLAAPAAEPVTQGSMVNHAGVTRDLCSSGKRPNLIITQGVFLISKFFFGLHFWSWMTRIWEHKWSSSQGSLVFQTAIVCRQMELLPRTKLLSWECFSYMTESDPKTSGCYGYILF